MISDKELDRILNFLDDKFRSLDRRFDHMDRLMEASAASHKDLEKRIEELERREIISSTKEKIKVSGWGMIGGLLMSLAVAGFKVFIGG